MKKAKINIWCNGQEFLAGQLYTAKEVAHLDPNDFEDVETVKEVIEDKKITKTKKK